MDQEERARRFGEALRKAREVSGLSVRAAAAKTDFTEGQWRQMEKGYRQVTKDVRVPTNPRPDTVRGAARAVEWDEAEALELAGYDEESRRARLNLAPELAHSLGRLIPPASTDNPVVTAIEADPYLLPEAKQHFLNQYRLLLRIRNEAVHGAAAEPAVASPSALPRAARAGTSKRDRGEDEQQS